MLQQNEKSEGSEIGIMDVLYISPASPRTPRPFSASPLGASRCALRSRHTRTASGQLIAPAHPSPAAGRCICPLSTAHGISAHSQHYTVILPNATRKTGQNLHLNATKIIFGCVRYFIASIQRSSPVPNTIRTSGGPSSCPGGVR